MAALNIAHRGARSLAPENTIPAARKAVEIGADMWEMDVAMTVDGEMVVIHDDTLERTSNARAVFPARSPWRVADFSYAELLELDFGSWFVQTDPFKQIAAGKVSAAEQASFAGVRIPTLKEILLFTRDNNWRVNVELKDLSGTAGDAHGVEMAVGLIRDLGMIDQVLISSFNLTYLERTRAFEPRIRTAALVEEHVPDPVALLRRLQAQAFHPESGMIQAEMVEKVHQAGLLIQAWTVADDEAALRRMLDLGVDGIFTDFPQLLKELQK